jgi:AcrR family transcriptional regulator
VLNIELLLSPLRVTPQPTLKIGKSEHTRAAILNATLDFVWPRPFRDMTISALMTSTGVNRSAFYQYFKDPHEVMEALLERLKGEILEASKPWMTGVGDPVALLNETFAGFVVHPVLIALTRLNAYTLIQAFGQHPRSQPEPVRDALARIWVSTLYEAKWVGRESSDLVRK